MDNVWTIQDTNLKPDDIGTLQPEVELDNDMSFFTRTTDLHNPRRVAEILKMYPSVQTCPTSNGVKYGTY